MTREDKERAESRKAIRKAQEAKQAIPQYEVDAQVVREKTARLRALRLAKEVADAKEAAEKKPEIKELKSDSFYSRRQAEYVHVSCVLTLGDKFRKRVAFRRTHEKFGKGLA